MSRGAPDYRLYQQKETLLGTYDRRGDVVDHDDFENPVLKWNVTAAVAGDAAVLDTTNCQSGAQAVKLTCANNALADVTLRRGTGLLGTKRIGLEISFGRVDNGLYLQFTNLCEYGGQLLYGSIRIDALTGIAEYWSAAGAWVPFANIGVLRNELWLFHTLKFVIDFPNDRYVRAIINDTEYDLRAATPLPVAAFIPNFVAYVLQAHTKDGVGGDAWLDDFILTINEP